MRDQSLFAVLATALTAFASVVAVMILSNEASAEETAARKRPARQAPAARGDTPDKRPPVPAAPRAFRDLTTRDFVDATTKLRTNEVQVGSVEHGGRVTETIPVSLDDGDHYAALESISFALAEVGDGASYVWHRHNGRLSGVVQPTASFKTSTGEVCRVVVVTLAAGRRSKTAEGVACRLQNGQWRLEG